eukprot:Rmarinus@m.28130
MKCYFLGAAFFFSSAVSFPTEFGVQPRTYEVIFSGLGKEIFQHGDPLPLESAYGHADQEKYVSFLQEGFCNIEVDVHLIEGDIYVGHDCDTPTDCPDRFFDEYLIPLVEVVEDHGGYVFAQTPETGLCPYLTLMPDVKTGAFETYEVLEAMLVAVHSAYPGFLTTFEGGEVQSGAVSVVITGNRPSQSFVRRQSPRLVALDGRFDQTAMHKNEDNVYPWVSQNVKTVFPGTSGLLTDDELAILEDLIAQAHSRSQKIRMWATQEDEELWHQLMRSGMDVINTDQYSRLASFLIENDYVYRTAERKTR